MEAIVEKDPDIILFMPCGYDIKKTESEMGTLTSKREWKALKAVQNGDVIITDGNQYFNRPGPRIVDSFEILAEIFYPDHFSPDHYNVGWKRFKI